MTKNKIIDNKLILLLTLVIIVFSDDTMMFGTNSIEMFTNIKLLVQIITCLILCYRFIRDGSVRRVQKPGQYCLFFCAIIIACMIMNRDIRLGYFFMICIVLMSFLFAYYIDFKSFIECFEKVIFYLAVCSIIGMVLGEIYPAALRLLPTITNAGGHKFSNAFVFVYSDIWGRSFGIFREPGVFQLFLILGMLFNLYIYEKVSIFRTLIYSVAVIFTLSTTGFIALFFILIVYLIRIGKHNAGLWFGFVIVLGVGVSILLTKTNLLSVNGSVFNKFLDTGKTRLTTAARYSSITSNIKIWLSNPILGRGLSFVDSEFWVLTIRDYGVDTRSNTNTLLCMLSTYGAFFVAIILSGYSKLIRLLTTSKIEALLICGVLIILSCGERLTFSPIIYILCFYGMQVSYEHRRISDV